MLEIYTDEAMKTDSDVPFKGNLDLDKFEAVIKKYGREKIPFVRMEATTNLIGGQPFSMANLKEVRQMASAHGIPVVIDCSLISENAYFIKRREPAYADATIAEIVREMMAQADLIYLSGRKSTCVRGGLIATNNPEYFEQLKAWLPLYEGFITYGGMSSKEIEAMAVGIREMVDYDVASSSADLIAYFVDNMVKRGIPAVTPPGGLAGHVDGTRFLPHVPQSQYIAGALNAAIYLVSGVRGMERGTISMDRDAKGNDVFSDMELCRLAVPRRVYTVSHMDYVVDRLEWLYKHRNLVGGLKFVHEPPVLRFFTGKLEALDGWDKKLAEAFTADFGSELLAQPGGCDREHRRISPLGTQADRLARRLSAASRAISGHVAGEAGRDSFAASGRSARARRTVRRHPSRRRADHLPGITHWQSPNFFGFFPSNNSGPSILGELLSAGLGVQGMLWSTSPACTELETHVLDWLVDLLALPPAFKSTSTGGGVIQDSASSATLCAILAARERATEGQSNLRGADGSLDGLHFHASPFVRRKGSANRRTRQRQPALDRRR